MANVNHTILFAAEIKGSFPPRVVGVEEKRVHIAPQGMKRGLEDSVGEAIADGDLTFGELKTLPSLLMGSASFFEYVNQIGALRPQGPGNGKIEIASSGTLADGRDFQFSVREMGVDQISTLRHIRIEFR